MSEGDLFDPKLNPFRKLWGKSDRENYLHDGLFGDPRFYFLDELMRYEKRFRRSLQAFGYDSFDALIADQKKQSPGRRISVLDVMGGGHFVDSKTVDHIVGIRLFNQDAKHFARQTSPANRHLVTGDILETATLKKLQSTMKGENIPGFDLIVCSPVGPFSQGAPTDIINTQASFERQSENFNTWNAALLDGYGTLQQHYMLNTMNRDKPSFIFSELPHGIGKNEWIQFVRQHPSQFAGCTIVVDILKKSYENTSDYQQHGADLHRIFSDRVQFGLKYDPKDANQPPQILSPNQ